LLVLLLFPSIVIQTIAVNPEFKLVKTIGDERDDYTIFGLGDAIITDDNDIYILNVRGNHIAKFGWDGLYKGKFGQKGQGPSDLYFPRSLAYFQGKIFVLDRGNHRIAEINISDGKFQYYKYSQNTRISNGLFVLDDCKFMGIFSEIKRNRGRIGIMDKKFNIIRSFFNKYPIDMDLGNGSFTFKDGMSPDKIVRITTLNNSFEPVYDYDRSSNEIIVSFRSPDNPIRFFVYNIDGKLVREFSYTINEKKYKFSRLFLDTPISKLREPKKWPPRFEPNLRVYIHNNHYVAFLALHDFEGKEIVRRRYFCLIFGRDGNLISRIPLNSKLLIIRESNGFFLASLWEEDIEKLYIYRLENGTVKKQGDKS
jgi:hypothetical protein